MALINYEDGRRIDLIGDIHLNTAEKTLKYLAGEENKKRLNGVGNLKPKSLSRDVVGKVYVNGREERYIVPIPPEIIDTVVLGTYAAQRS